MTTQTFTRTLNVKVCPVDDCGITYGIDSRVDAINEEKGRSWYCPNGHSLHYLAETAEQKIRRLESQRTHLQDQLQGAQNTVIAYKGHLTRTKNKLERAEAGVCPHCNRSFQNLRRHVKGQHPEVLHGA